MDTNQTKLVFMGTSEFAVPILEKLAENFNIQLVVTQPDKPAGRGHKITCSPVKKKAQDLSLKISQPAKIKENQDFFKQLEQINPDVIVVAAYGKILPAQIINLPQHGCINVHGSLLPKYRGASPIQTAILNGDDLTGISIMLMDLGMDTGDVMTKECLEIENSDTFNSLSKKLSDLASKMIVDVIPDYIKGNINLEMQDDEKATYCTKLTSDLAQINWQKTSEEVHNHIRALCEQIKTFSYFNNKKLYLYPGCQVNNEYSQQVQAEPGQVLICPHNKKAICVKCGQGLYELGQVKLEGKNKVSAKDFTNGYQNFIGTILQ